MPTVFTHALAAGALGAWCLRRGVARRVWVAGVLCAVLPDADVIAFQLGVVSGHPLGHRGLTHSLAFAVALGLFAALLVSERRPSVPAGRIAAYLCLAAASHGVLDAFTNGGPGIAFFAPFDATRYFFPIRPIEVSPIGMRRFFAHGGLEVLASEARWIWPPCALAILAAAWMRRSRRRAPTRAPGDSSLRATR